MRSHCMLVLVTALLIMASPATFAEEFAWPGGAKVAISLAYDDALHTHLDHAIPALDRHGLKGSFYMTLASEATRERLEEWRVAAANGHELANHTLFHPCQGSMAGREWVQPWNDLDTMTMAEIREHIVLANTMLRAIDGETERTYTAVCGDQLAGGQPYLEMVEDLFVGMKTNFAHEGIVPDMATLDPMRVPVDGPVGWSGEKMIGIVQRGADAGTMVNFTFHGIGGDHLSVTTQAHEQLLEHLAANPDIYWVATFRDIMKHVAKQREALIRP